MKLPAWRSEREDGRLKHLQDAKRLGRYDGKYGLPRPGLWRFGGDRLGRSLFSRYLEGYGDGIRQRRS